jgi:HAD superfamily hydrolase (TIGR01490 family)
MKSLAIFDFDGTLANGNSLTAFARYSHSFVQYCFSIAFVFPIYCLFRIKLISDNFAKTAFVWIFYRNRFAPSILKLAETFALNGIDKSLDPFHLKRLEWHKSQGHAIVIISASLRFILEYWCNKTTVDLIATEVEIGNDNKFTGLLKGKNCYGKMKEIALKRHYNLQSFEYIYAYGNSKGDLEILKLANEQYFKGKQI